MGSHTVQFECSLSLIKCRCHRNNGPLVIIFFVYHSRGQLAQLLCHFPLSCSIPILLNKSPKCGAPSSIPFFSSSPQCPSPMQLLSTILPPSMCPSFPALLVFAPRTFANAPRRLRQAFVLEMLAMVLVSSANVQKNIAATAMVSNFVLSRDVSSRTHTASPI